MKLFWLAFFDICLLRIRKASDSKVLKMSSTKTDLKMSTKLVVLLIFLWSYVKIICVPLSLCIALDCSEHFQSFSHSEKNTLEKCEQIDIQSNPEQLEFFKACEYCNKYFLILRFFDCCQRVVGWVFWKCRVTKKLSDSESPEQDWGNICSTFQHFQQIHTNLQIQGIQKQFIFFTRVFNGNFHQHGTLLFLISYYMQRNLQDFDRSSEEFKKTNWIIILFFFSININFL